MTKLRGLSTLVLRALAMGMGAATVVLSVLKTLSLEAGITMLGLGLFSLSLAALNKSAGESGSGK